MTQALILANALAFCDSSVASQAAAELRAQHARIAELEQGKCLHQIAEPAVARREAFEAWARSYGTWEVQRDDSQELGLTGYTDVNLSIAWHAVQSEAAAPQAVKASVPDGWKLVPLEPTQAMIDAMPPVEEVGYWAMYEAAIASAPAAPTHPVEGVPAIFGDEDHVLVPRGLIGAACSAIDKKRDGTKTLAELRRYTTGDLSAATQPAAQGVMEQFIESQHKLAAMIARTEHAEAKLDAIEFEAKAYRWLRDENDWYAEPRLDAEDGTVWKLTMYSPQEIIDPTDDDSLDAAVLAALAAQAGAQP